MEIAIVDDDPSDLFMAKTYLKKFIHENYPDEETAITIKTFSKAKDMILSFTPGQYAVMLLDIRMNEITGMQAARIVRGRGDDNVKIIFLTSSDDYLLDGYRVFASGYIMKPLREHVAEFETTFSFVFSQIFVKQKEFLITVNHVEVSVPYKIISYIDIDEHHKLCIHLADKKLVTTMTYLSCYEILSEDDRFLECYHRIIVNMDHIKTMANEDFILHDGTIIPISQRKRKEVKAKYMHYLAHRD